MADPVRCAVYTRKSSEEGLEQSFNSLHAQREACEAYIVSQKHEGWQLVPTAYDDGGYSGGSMERPGLKALLADVEAGLVDTIVVYKVDRLSRSLSDFAKMVDRFDANGVSFVSVTQAFNTTTSMGRLTLNMLLSFAQFEREVTGERIRDKIAASKAKGMWMGGLVPLGYDVHERLLVINEAEAAQVRQLFALYRKCKAVDAVVEQAYALGIRSKIRLDANGTGTSGGGKLGRGSLYRILSNRLYVGEIEHKGQCHKGLHDRIVEPDLFDAVQQILASQRRKRSVGTSQTALLSGLVEDAYGTKLTATHTKKGIKRYRYYAGGELRIPGEELEALVREGLVARFKAPAALGALLPDLATLTPAVIDAAAILAKTLSSSAPQTVRGALLGLVTRVTVAPAEVRVMLALSKIGLSGTATLAIPAAVGRSRAKLSLVVPGLSVPKPDPTLIALVAQARDWFERLATGQAGTFAQLASAVGVTETYVRQILPAAFLAPDIVTCIVEGRHSPTLTASRLKELLPLPDTWDEQRALIDALA